jgi:hypothetical protein
VNKERAAKLWRFSVDCKNAQVDAAIQNRRQCTEGVKPTLRKVGLVSNRIFVNLVLLDDLRKVRLDWPGER